MHVQQRLPVLCPAGACKVGAAVFQCSGAVPGQHVHGRCRGCFLVGAYGVEAPIFLRSCNIQDWNMSSRASLTLCPAIICTELGLVYKAQYWACAQPGTTALYCACALQESLLCMHWPDSCSIPNCACAHWAQCQWPFHCVQGMLPREQTTSKGVQKNI